MIAVQTPDFAIFYEKTNITENLKPYLIEVIYTDYLEGQSDEVQLVFEDIEGKWIRTWWPTQGDKVRLQLGYLGEALVDLGQFEIDEIEYQYPPSIINLKALSTGISKSNRTLKPRAYENTTLADIVRSVASRAKLKVTGEIKHIPIKRVTQYQERDVEFLTRLAKEYNHSFKIVNDMLVFTTMASLKDKDAVYEFDPTHVISVRLRDRIKDTAKSVEVSAYDAAGKKVVKKSKTHKSRRPSKKQAAASSGDTLKIVTRGESDEQVEARVDAHLEQQDDDQQAGEIELVGNPKLVAGNTFKINKIGMFSGKYLIKSARHHLSRRSGYTTALEVKMIEYIEEGSDANT